MPKSLLALPCLLLLQFNLHAQNTSPDGYYINTKGDTIFGKFINYPEYKASPATIPFQPTGASAEIQLSPANCTKVVIAHSDTYIAYKGKRLTNETDYRIAEGKTDDAYEDVTVFLRQLFDDGRFQLYELTDSKRNNYYISSASTPLKELYFRAYTEDNNVVESPYFRSQLSFLFRDSLKQASRLQNQLEKTTYTAESLTRLFALVTTGKASGGPKEKYPARFFAGLGASFNMFTVKGDQTQMPTIVGNYKTMVSPLVEIGVRLYSQRNYGRLFFTIRANAYKYKNTLHFPGYPYSPNSASDNTFKATVITVPVSAGYQFIHGKNLSVAFSAGAAALILFNNISTTTSAYSTSQRDNAVSFTYNAFGEAEAVWMKTLSLYAGGYIPASVGNYAYYAPRHSSIKVGLRYYF